MVGGQSTGQVYHAVGPAMFTNAAVWGYPDGLLAGSNFLCGVYAGTASNDLTPCFGSPDGNLKEHFWLGFGRAWLWGNVVVDAPVEKPLVLQFRAWPAEFGSYEAAVAWSNPSPPVGTSEIVPALEYGWIYEVFWEAGPVWLAVGSARRRAWSVGLQARCQLDPRLVADEFGKLAARCYKLAHLEGSVERGGRTGGRYQWLQPSHGSAD
jgi:hypothetical protein